MVIGRRNASKSFGMPATQRRAVRAGTTCQRTTVTLVHPQLERHGEGWQSLVIR